MSHKSSFSLRYFFAFSKDLTAILLAILLLSMDLDFLNKMNFIDKTEKRRNKKIKIIIY